jgi:hypothetical protein
MSIESKQCAGRRMKGTPRFECMKLSPLFPFFLCVFASFLLSSCAQSDAAAFSLYDAEGRAVTLTADSHEAAAGILPHTHPVQYRYAPAESITAGPDTSLEIEYSLNASASAPFPPDFTITVRFDNGAAWVLPLDLDFLGTPGLPGQAVSEATGIRYAVPVTGLIREISVGTTGVADERRSFDQSISLLTGRADTSAPSVTIHALRLVDRWYGYAFSTDAVWTTPFVYQDQSGFVIDPPLEYRFTAAPVTVILTILGGSSSVAEAGVVSGPLSVQLGESRLDYRAVPDRLAVNLVPYGLDADPWPLAVTADGAPVAIAIASAGTPQPERRTPISADPVLILEWRQDAWRDERYEVFRWDAFPSVLIFDTASYNVQDRLFRRLAFYVEKAGYRGRLLTDRELEGQHGWNAHDYRAEDLARFFEAAQAADFPLLREELELQDLLLAEGIVRRGADGAFSAGEGAIISVSRDSSASLRQQFMAHEGFHGIFFVDPEFRDFSQRRWNALGATAKTFITSYFDYMHYDIDDPYLMVNEFMAYMLELPVSAIAQRFGKTLPETIEAITWRRNTLPEKDEATGTWPALAEAFTTEAAAFNAYVDGRWALAAGRTWNVRR